MKINQTQIPRKNFFTGRAAKDRTGHKEYNKIRKLHN
jgi:hypothetical protein